MSYYSGSIAPGSSIGESKFGSGGEVKNLLLTWDKCNTRSQQISYIVGQALHVVIATGVDFTKKVITVLHIDDISRFFLKIINSTCNNGIDLLGKICDLAARCLKPIVVNGTTKKIGKWTYEHATNFLNCCITNIANIIFSESLYNGLSTVGRACKSVFSGFKQCLTTLANWTIVPVYNHILSPVGKKIWRVVSKAFSYCCPKRKTENVDKGRIKDSSHQPCSKTLKTIADWTIVPLWNRVVKPAGTTVLEIAHGFISGCYRPGEETNMNVDEEIDIRTFASGIMEAYQNNNLYNQGDLYNVVYSTGFFANPVQHLVTMMIERGIAESKSFNAKDNLRVFIIRQIPSFARKVNLELLQSIAAKRFADDTRALAVINSSFAHALFIKELKCATTKLETALNEKNLNISEQEEELRVVLSVFALAKQGDYYHNPRILLL